MEKSLNCDFKFLWEPWKEAFGNQHHLICNCEPAPDYSTHSMGKSIGFDAPELTHNLARAFAALTQKGWGKMNAPSKL